MVRLRLPVTCVAASALLVAGCGSNEGTAYVGSGDDAQWAVIQEYIELREAWDSSAGELRNALASISGGAPDEMLQRLEEAHGPLPDVSAAVAAAREIIGTGGAYTAKAAAFLLARVGDPVAMLERARQVGNLAQEVGLEAANATFRADEDLAWEALIAHVGPEWAIVQDYLDEQGGGPPDTSKAIRAAAAARAVLDAGTHVKTVEAAEFLIDHALSLPSRDRHVVVAARALEANVPPGYTGWPRILRRLDFVRGLGRMGSAPNSPVDSFFERAADADDPVLRAAARYGLAVGLMRNDSPEGRESRRERALAMATGLSAGVEDETYDGGVPGSGRPVRTFAEAEADLIATIRHGSVGGTLPELSGRRLDGTEEPLAAYRGRVLLIDWWATWCVPCIIALPELRELVADLPADRFALLAISVDEEVATVTELMEREPMPWRNWHVGTGSDLERVLGVQGFPTYILADEEGTILAHGLGPLRRLRCMVERAVAGEDPTCPPAEWMGRP